MNLLEFNGGGVYKITCIKNNKIYYGQRSCFFRPCSQHLKLFKDKKHYCCELQEHVCCYGLHNFRFEVVVNENTLKKRLQIEKQYIDTTPKELIYNIIKIHNFKTKPRIAQRIKVHNIVFPSIKEASRILKQSTGNIGLKLDDASNTNYKRLHYHPHIYFDTYEVKIANYQFKSTRAVVDAGLATTTRQVRDRCRSKKCTDWQFIEKQV